MTSQAGPRIRRATAGDAAAVADVYLASFKATYDFPPAHTDDEVRGWMRDALLPTSEVWVAEEDAAVVGFVAIGEGTVEQLYVAPARTGQGIGARLLDLAKARRPQGLSLWTFQANSGARRFYARHGFRVAEMTDGSGNEERQPDVRYVWP